MKFSERNGFKSLNEVIQIESIDERLRNKIFNCIHEAVFSTMENPVMFPKRHVKKFCEQIWTCFFDELIDSTPSFSMNPALGNNFKRHFKSRYFALEWYEVYDLIEFICELDKVHFFGFDFQSICNEVLERENSGYRIINCSVVKTTSQVEIEEIEKALNESINSVRTHLESALNLLTNREAPDYRNSIKESISSVESLCCRITGNNKASLGDALKVIGEKYKLHGALKKSFSALYGYTSDAGGIRHKLLDDDVEITYDDAKFMLVSCSAFTNYLQSKIEN